MTGVGTVAVIGEAVRVAGFGLAGARVLVAEDAEEVRTAWLSLGPGVAVVVLTPRAAKALGATGPGEASGGPLTVVMPA
ncbi:V-type ATP synthase subunit F [Microbispora sp. NBC_01189]|uniref:V-type ATP synthase subunit F n=1 Tax=Microbispora sp. NBC_01189 TaxID=2903583 RepID=UPI002E1371AF|nr:V-type ATP synthase subunit F [Microbispora sp. NBC_01189]